MKQNQEMKELLKVLIKKLSDTERELTEQLNSQNQTKTSLETKTKQARDQYSELKRQSDTLQNEKENLDQKLKRLEQSLNTDQQELISVRKNIGELENQIRILQSKIKEIETRIQTEAEDSQRGELKRQQLNSVASEQKKIY